MNRTYLSLLLGAVVLTSASPAIAAVTLNVDNYIKVTAINGQAVTHGLLQPLRQEFSLEPGRHVITAKYDRLYEFRNRNTHDYLRSDNVTVTAELADNQTYRLVMPGQPEDYNDAREYAKAPSLAIMHGDTIIVQENSTKSSGGLLSSIGSLFGRGNAAAQNQQVVAAVNSQPQTATQPAQTTVTHSTPVVTQSQMPTRTDNTLDGFMRLWMNATPAEREKIRQWVAE